MSINNLLRQIGCQKSLFVVFVPSKSLYGLSRDKQDSHMSTLYFDWELNQTQLLTSNMNMSEFGVPPYLKSRQFWELPDLLFYFFSCGILQHKIFIITSSRDGLRCDSLYNPVAKSDKSPKDLCFTRCLVLLGIFYFVMLQLKYPAIAYLIRARREEVCRERKEFII